MESLKSVGEGPWLIYTVDGQTFDGVRGDLRTPLAHRTLGVGEGIA